MAQNEISEEKEFVKQSYRKLNKKRIRNIVLNIITIILAIGAIVWVGNLFYRYHKYEITNDATIEQYITPINVRISGYIKDIRFTEHQWVEKGDTLLVIDDREYRIKEKDAEAALLDAQNSLTVLGASINTTSANVAVSKANIDEAKAKLWRAEQDLTRYKNLLDAESVSQQQYDQVKADYDAQKAHSEALVNQSKSLKSTSQEALQRQKSAEAAILRREADLDMAKLNLSYTIITAPYSGYVGRRTLEIGQLVQAGQTITNLIRNDNKWVIANFKETQITNIKIGQTVKLKVDAIKGKVFEGKVSAISEATGSKYSMLPTDNSAGNFVKIQQRIPVRIDFSDIKEDEMESLRAGMMVIVEAIK